MLIHLPMFVVISFDLVLALWPSSLRPLSVCMSPDNAAQQFWVMGWSWGGGGWLTGCIIRRFHCPWTGVLNQPQVVDKKIWIQSQQGPLPAAPSRCWHCRSWPDTQSLSSVGQDPMMRKEKTLSQSVVLPFPHPLGDSQGNSYFGNTGVMCERELVASAIIWCMIQTQWMTAVIFTCTESKGSLPHHRLSPVSHASKNIINPIMREILMRCALKSDSGVIIRVILPDVESWSWTEACSKAESERKCCYACRSCSHLCFNQGLYIICFFLQRDF